MPLALNADPWRRMELAHETEVSVCFKFSGLRGFILMMMVEERCDLSLSLSALVWKCNNCSHKIDRLRSVVLYLI